jgi:hypothetical protein
VEDLSDPTNDLLKDSNYCVTNLNCIEIDTLVKGNFVQFTAEDGSSYFIEVTGTTMISIDGSISRRGKIPEVSPTGEYLDEFDNLPVVLSSDWSLLVGKRVLAFSADLSRIRSLVTAPISPGSLQLIVPIETVSS